MDIKKLLGAITVTALVGCASAPQTPQEKVVQNTIDDLPNWYLELPEADDDEKVIYVAGTGRSGMLMLAKDKAILDVEKQLANKVHAKISARVKQYIREVGAGTPLTIEDNEFVVKKVVTEANVAGYVQKELEIRREKDLYRVYLLAEYPIEGNTLRAIAQTEDMIRKFKGDKEKAFKELDREIDSNRSDSTLNETPLTDYRPLEDNGIQERVIVDNTTGTETYPL